MTATTTTPATTVTKTRADRERMLHQQMVAEQLRRNAARVRKADLPRMADELYALLRTIQKRADELNDLVHDALDTHNDVWLEIYGTQRDVNSVIVDFIASPRDLNLLMCAVESNTPFRDVKPRDEE